jgi:sugar transferase (PEP-CTERM system associated)
MSNTRFRARTIGLIIAEATIIFGGVIMALYLRVGAHDASYELNERYGWYKAVFATVICMIALYLYDLYDYTVMNNRRELLLRLMQAFGIAWAVLALLFYAVPFLLIGRGVSLISVPLVMFLLLIWRLIVHSLTGHPDIGEKVLIVGSGKTAIDTAKVVLDRRDAGYRVVGFLSSEQEQIGKSLVNPKVIGLMDELEEIVKRERVDRIVVAIRDRRGNFPTDKLLHLSLSGDVNIEECTSFYERITGQVNLEMVRPSWLIFAGRGRDTRLVTFFREMIHRGLALIGLTLSLPIAVLTAILIKLESPGPIFYRQERVGKHGHIFKVIKFRSMRMDAEKDGPVWAKNNDDRVTRIGKIIRLIRVDEIPQFWNIIKGEMNFVGPRPERPHFVEQLAEEIPLYEQRHLVAPGLTGWAQIKYPYGASVDDAKQKLQYDLYYIKNQSLALDLIIVFETIKIVLFGKGAR